MTTSFLFLSNDEFRRSCESFFVGEHSPEAIAASLKQQTPDTLLMWIAALGEAYDAHVGGYIRAWVAQVRQGWDWQTHEGIADPLDTPENKEQCEAYRAIRYGLFEQYVTTLARYDELNTVRIANLQAQAAEDRLHVTVDGVAYRAEAATDVLWSGWECDSTVWVINDQGVRRIVTSDHGHLQFVGQGFLEERIAAYETALQETRNLLALATRCPIKDECHPLNLPVLE